MVNLEEFCARLIQGALKEDARNAAEDLFLDSEDGAVFFGLADWVMGRFMEFLKALHVYGILIWDMGYDGIERTMTWWWDMKYMVI